MLLAFDTATSLVSVALFDHDRVIAELSSDRTMKHGESLAPLIDQVMRQAGVHRSRLTAIGVGVGPGPFTGLRVGLVTARTLGYVLQIPVHGVCTLDVLAVQATQSGLAEGEFAVATDARRKEVYVAHYRAGLRVSGPEVLRPADAATELPVAGEGPVLYPDAFPNAIALTRPSAGWLARTVADGAAELLDPDPLYLRRPDAVEPPAPKRVS